VQDRREENWRVNDYLKEETDVMCQQILNYWSEYKENQ
jgi:hypothetical protein